MREQLEALAKLSEIDVSARDIDGELEQIPLRISGMRADVQQLQSLLERERNQLRDAEQLKDSQLQQLQEQSEQLAKSKAKAAKARNAREADAVERELENVRRSSKDAEAEGERLGAAIGQVRASVAQHEQELEQLQALFEKEEAAAQQRIDELQAQRAEVVKGREEIARTLEPGLVRRYDQIRQRRGNAVVAIRDGICTGCRMSIPAQEYIRIQSSEIIDQCPHCRRILVYTAPAVT